MSHEVEVGTYVDLSYMNKGRAGSVQKKSFQEAVDSACEVGTAFVFNLTAQGLKAARRIPVVYA